jgi:hypothetical protein
MQRRARSLRGTNGRPGRLAAPLSERMTKPRTYCRRRRSAAPARPVAVPEVLPPVPVRTGLQ